MQVSCRVPWASGLSAKLGSALLVLVGTWHLHGDDSCVVSATCGERGGNCQDGLVEQGHSGFEARRGILWTVAERREENAQADWSRCRETEVRGSRTSGELKT